MGKEIFSDCYAIEKDGKYYLAELSIELVESVLVKKDPIGEPTKRLENIDPLKEKTRSLIKEIIEKKTQ